MASLGGPHIVTEGLVLHLDAANTKSYPGSGTTWFDKSGNANNGTLTNGPTFSSLNGGSIILDGVNDYGKSTNINPTGNRPVTVSVWSNILTNQSGDRGLFLYGRAGTLFNVGGIYYRNSDNFVRFTTWGGVNQDYATGFIKDFNVWHHWVMTYSSTLVTVYRDGVIDPNGNQVRTLNFSLTDLEIAGTTFTSLFMNCNIAQTSVYNRALTAEEILQNYNATKSRFNL
jgi:hypothetical protein